MARSKGGYAGQRLAWDKNGGILQSETSWNLAIVRMHICAYNIVVDYQWDNHKAQSNLLKHGVDFVDAVTVFTDDRAVTIEDDNPVEDRFITLGMDALGRILVVVYTHRGEGIRIISARKATARERRQYYE